ncbi:MAG: hypothetical protein EOO61_14885, partial [Hymenobacter sp.]
RMKDPVFRLRKCLYGHPASGRWWAEHLVKVLKGHGWAQLEGVPSCYARGVGAHRTLLVAYVDDLVLAGQSKQVDATWKELNALLAIGSGN